jgi:copper(I)-binding protein
MHVMFMGMKEDLAPDELIPGELTFEKAGKLKVEFMIEAAGTDHSMDNM